MLPLGLTTPQRSRAAPQIAPLADNAKLAGFDMGAWFGLLGPAKLPVGDIARLNTALREVLQDLAVWRKGRIENDVIPIIPVALRGR
jgi:tripartite-type tricarboxylate transporter receptor subunit TctC